MDIFISAIILILTTTVFFLPVKIFLNLRKYKEAALALIFNKLEKSIVAFKIYAVAILFFSTGRLLDLLNITSSSPLIDDLATFLNLITTVLLIYAFYRLLKIIEIESGTF
ncbi:MAG: hypothetical protein HVN35_10080 [Methanobacteriaceae archaeon]|nr:hypothetical protein [Methanobacteriaceae archaeon]